MENVKLATWETIKEIAANIFNILSSGNDIEWAETAWRHIEKTPLVNFSNEEEYYSVLVYLFCLGELYHEYNDIARDERYERDIKYTEWVNESRLQKIRFVLLAGENYYQDYYIEEYDGIFEVIDGLIDKQYPAVIELLVNIFGGRNELMMSLEKSSGRSSGDGLTEEELIELGVKPEELMISYETINLHEWKEYGFPRSYG
jgi:hypothetical protein